MRSAAGSGYGDRTGAMVISHKRVKQSLSIAALLGAGGAASVASAAPSASWTTATASAAAISADPAAANSITNILNVTVPTGADWQGAKIRISLTAGTVYNTASASGGTEDAPNQAFWGFVPAQQYDTFINSKGYTTGVQLGTVNADGSDGSLPSSGLSGTGRTLVSIAWGNVVPAEDGTFSVGQFTFSSTATGTFFGAISDTNGTTPFSGTVVNGKLIATGVPEPTTAALLTGGGLLALSRRRRAR